MLRISERLKAILHSQLTALTALGRLKVLSIEYKEHQIVIVRRIVKRKPGLPWEKEKAMPELPNYLQMSRI